MDNVFVCKSLIVLLLISAASEAFFFDHPKTALADFLHSVKEKKEEVKVSQWDVHHYHLHYYPVPVTVEIAEEPAEDSQEHDDDQHELEHLHSEHLRASGWGEHGYNHVPQQGFVVPVPAGHPQIFSDHRHHSGHGPDSPTIRDHELRDMAAMRRKIEQRANKKKKPAIVEPRRKPHATVHLPFHRQTISKQPAATAAGHRGEKSKGQHLLTAIFRKLYTAKGSLSSLSPLSSHKNHEKPAPRKRDDKIEKPVATLPSNFKGANTFAIHFRPKNLKKIHND